MADIYLDNNATTRPLDSVCRSISTALTSGYGNPSSVHSLGDESRSLVRDAREQVSALINAEPRTIFFTSGATESNNFIFQNTRHRVGAHLRVITTEIEHSSIKETADRLEDQGADVVRLSVDSNGRIQIDELQRALTTTTDLVSIQWANSETGVLQPIEKIGEICQEMGVPFHTDAVQVLGKQMIDVSSMPIDSMSFTAHKLHGPKGVGAVYMKSTARAEPMIVGGPQEFSKRAGTENVPGIVGFGQAAKERLEGFDATQQQLSQLRNLLEEQIQALIPDCLINGDQGRRINNTTNIFFPSVDGQAMVVRLDQMGVLCSQSSACISQHPEPSYVLRAMGLSEVDAYSSVRFSVSILNTEAEINRAAKIIGEIGQVLQNSANRGQSSFHVA